MKPLKGNPTLRLLRLVLRRFNRLELLIQNNSRSLPDDLIDTPAVRMLTRMSDRTLSRRRSDGLILIRRGMGFFVAEGSQARTLEAQRHEFIRVELHTMFARMDELGIDMNDLQTLHNNYLKRKSHELY